MHGLDHGSQDHENIVIPLIDVMVDVLAVEVIAVQTVGWVQPGESVMKPHGVVVKLVLLGFVP